MSNKAQTKRLDDLIRRVVFNEEERCYVCQGQPTDLAHLFVRNRLPTRWSKRNCHALCRGCHGESHTGSDIYANTFIRVAGEVAYDELRLESNQMVGNVHMFMDQKERELNEML
jgi:hypothetical protein